MKMNFWGGNPFAYVVAGTKIIVADRSLLFVDMVLATTIPILLQVAIWSALFKTDLDISYAFSEIIRYYVFVVCLSRINNGYDIVEQLSDAIHGGTLDPHLVRPIPYWMQSLSTFIGGSVIYLIVVFAAISIDILVRGWQFEGGIITTIWFSLLAILVLIVTQILTFFISFTFALLVVWTTRPELALSLLILLQTILGGTLLPPDLWGGWLYWLMSFNPFAFMLAAPAEFLSSRNAVDGLYTIFGSLCYIAIFAIVSKVLWKIVEQHFEGVGG